MFHRGHYVNLGAAMISAAGTPCALVAGKHSRGFPYADSSAWDDLLLSVGERGWALPGRASDSLAIELDGDAVSIAYRGPLEGGAEVEVELQCRAVGFLPLALGTPWPALRSRWTPGLQWRPFSLLSIGGAIRVDGAEHAITRGFGELEQGELLNLSARAWAIAYDYVALAYPGSAADAGYAYVCFDSRALLERRGINRLVDWLSRRYGSKERTLQGQIMHQGNRHGVAVERAEILAGRRVDLGPAQLERRLVRTTDARARRLWGLMELFEPTA